MAMWETIYVKTGKELVRKAEEFKKDKKELLVNTGQVGFEIKGTKIKYMLKIEEQNILKCLDKGAEIFKGIDIYQYL